MAKAGLDGTKCLRVIKPDNTEQHARDLLEAKSEILTLRARISRGAFACRRVVRGTIGKRKKRLVGAEGFQVPLGASV